MGHEMCIRDRNKLVVVISIVAIYGILHPLIGRFGNDQVGSFFERDNYESKYYVNVFINEKNAKNYRLGADIEKIKECIPVGRDESECTSTYFVRQIYWLNGGFFTFDENECIIDSVQKHLCFPDQQNEGIYVEPTLQKVNP